MKTKLHSFEKVSPHKTAVHSGENWSSFGGNWSLLGRKLFRTAHRRFRPSRPLPQNKVKELFYRGENIAKPSCRMKKKLYFCGR